ncbi:hypothetical protein GPROT2_00308 [Gammaproteobacteria bacterium]|nr:hypothetical protein GPROT2_00308 [Gammaproteobacteria bacterium]
MGSTSLDGMVGHLLGLLVTAGDYALAIQPVSAGSADAGTSVQNFLEVATLARFPQLRFFGAEHARSLNQKYFPADAAIAVHLDPVNGAFLYRQQRSGWDILLGIADHGRLVAAISYMPARGRFYLALRERGALTGERRHPRLDDMVPLHTRPGARHCLTCQTPEINERLRGEFACFDLLRDDDPARGLDNLNEIYGGRLAAFACRDGDCLDWGAAAFIAVQAGGRATRLDGSPVSLFDDFDPQAPADLLVAADAMTHAAIMGRLQG